VPPQNLQFGGGVAETVLHPVVALAMLIAGVIMLGSSRRNALAAFLAAAILLPNDQVLMIGPLHFPALRVVALLGLMRILRSKLGSKQSVFSGGINKIDIAVILFAVFTLVDGILLWQSTAALIKMAGDFCTLIGVYLFLRFLIRDAADVDWAVQLFAVIAAVVAAVMTYEQVTGHNPYAWLGGARAFVYEAVQERENRARATAGFGHPILAGTFGAIMLPLFVGLWWRGRKFRNYAIVGIVSSTVIAWASGSSTPIMGYAAGVLALCLWPARRWMRAIRWGVVLMLVSLHMVMKAPVWQLIARVDLVGGNSADHRYQLVNQMILHFREWWLIGTYNYPNWGWGMWDTCNQYVAVGDKSGLLPFVLQLAMIVYGFKYLGRARKIPGTGKKDALFLWAMGAALFANVVAFFGISYFDQTMVAWYGLLAMIPTAALAHRKRVSAPEPQITGTAVGEPETLAAETDVMALSPASSGDWL
jgi:hypothetical protein